jgi:hypothetical protein
MPTEQPELFPDIIEKEKKILNKITDVHNEFMDLNSLHPNEKIEWITAIHHLQNIVGMRILQKEHSDIFPLYTKRRKCTECDVMINDNDVCGCEWSM